MSHKMHQSHSGTGGFAGGDDSSSSLDFASLANPPPPSPSGDSRRASYSGPLHGSGGVGGGSTARGGRALGRGESRHASFSGPFRGDGEGEGDGGRDMMMGGGRASFSAAAAGAGVAGGQRRASGLMRADAAAAGGQRRASGLMRADAAAAGGQRWASGLMRAGAAPGQQRLYQSYAGGFGGAAAAGLDESDASLDLATATAAAHAVSGGGGANHGGGRGGSGGMHASFSGPFRNGGRASFGAPQPQQPGRGQQGGRRASGLRAQKMGRNASMPQLRAGDAAAARQQQRPPLPGGGLRATRNASMPPLRGGVGGCAAAAGGGQKPPQNSAPRGPSPDDPSTPRARLDDVKVRGWKGVLLHPVGTALLLTIAASLGLFSLLDCAFMRVEVGFEPGNVNEAWTGYGADEQSTAAGSRGGYGINYGDDYFVEDDEVLGKDVDATGAGDLEEAVRPEQAEEGDTTTSTIIPDNDVDDVDSTQSAEAYGESTATAASAEEQLGDGARRQLRRRNMRSRRHARPPALRARAMEGDQKAEAAASTLTPDGKIPDLSGVGEMAGEGAEKESATRAAAETLPVEGAENDEAADPFAADFPVEEENDVATDPFAADFPIEDSITENQASDAFADDFPVEEYATETLPVEEGAEGEATDSLASESLIGAGADDETPDPFAADFPVEERTEDRPTDSLAADSSVGGTEDEARDTPDNLPVEGAEEGLASAFAEMPNNGAEVNTAAPVAAETPGDNGGDEVVAIQTTTSEVAKAEEALAAVEAGADGAEENPAVAVVVETSSAGSAEGNATAAAAVETPEVANAEDEASAAIYAESRAEDEEEEATNTAAAEGAEDKAAAATTTDAAAPADGAEEDASANATESVSDGDDAETAVIEGAPDDGDEDTYAGGTPDAVEAQEQQQAQQDGDEEDEDAPFYGEGNTYHSAFSSEGEEDGAPPSAGVTSAFVGIFSLCFPATGECYLSADPYYMLGLSAPIGRWGVQQHLVNVGGDGTDSGVTVIGDGSWTLARVAGILASLFGFAAMAFVWLIVCSPVRTSEYLLYLALTSALLEAVKTGFFFNIDLCTSPIFLDATNARTEGAYLREAQNCAVSGAGFASIFAVLFYAAAAVMIYRFPAGEGGGGGGGGFGHPDPLDKKNNAALTETNGTVQTQADSVMGDSDNSLDMGIVESFANEVAAAGGRGLRSSVTLANPATRNPSLRRLAQPGGPPPPGAAQQSGGGRGAGPRRASGIRMVRMQQQGRQSRLHQSYAGGFDGGDDSDASLDLATATAAAHVIPGAGAQQGRMHQSHSGPFRNGGRSASFSAPQPQGRRESGVRAMRMGRNASMPPLTED